MTRFGRLFSVTALTAIVGCIQTVGQEGVTDDLDVDVVGQEVIGGSATNSHPEVAKMFALLGDGLTHQCSATLIRSHFLLTNGHCVWASDGTDNRGGTVTFQRADGTQFNVSWTSARSLVIDGASDSNVDLAIVRLNRDITAAEAVPALLGNGPPQSGQAELVGWGCTSEAAKDWGTKRMFTGAWPIQNRICSGDSGGALFMNNRLMMVNQSTNFFADLPHHRNEIEAMIRQLDGGLEFGIDRGGNDITLVTVSSANACKTTCTKNVDCRAFSFSPSSGGCWLKRGVMTPSFSADRVSGIPDRFVAGFDTPGNDLSNFPSTKADECANACAMNPSCNAFTLNLGNNFCYLKSAVGTWSANANCTSGVRRTSESSTDHAGGDMSNFAATSEVTCSNTCATTFGCVAWSLNSGTCWLKDSLTDGLPAAAGVKSGFRKNFDFFADYVGNDLSNMLLSNWRPEQCQAICRNVSNCRAWTMNRGNRTCYLKSGIGVKQASPGAVTGMSHLDLF
jgi:hypothetical protein